MTLATYTKNKAGIDLQCSLQIRNTHSTTILAPITSNLWILSSMTEVDSEGITQICPDQAPKSIKVQKPIHILHLPPACSATSQHFHLPPCYENHQLMIIISLNTANLNAMNISSPEFWVWQHFEDHWNKTQLHKLADVPTVPVAHLYKHMINNIGPIHPFNLADESVDDTGSFWTLLSHTGIYVVAIGLLIPAGLGIFCCYFFSHQPTMLAHWPLWSGSMQHTIVDDDDVEAAPIYWSDGKAGQPILRSHVNHDLHMKWEPTWMESQQKQQAPLEAVSKSRSLDTKTQNPGNAMSTHGLL